MSKMGLDGKIAAMLTWELTFDSVPDAIAILDEHHQIVRVNRAMAQRLAVQPNDCIGQPCYRCVHGTDAPPALCPHTLSLADGKPHTAEVCEARLGGDFLVTTTPLLDAESRLIGSVHVARDISEQKKTEAEKAWLASYPTLNPNPIVELELDGRIAYANPSAQGLFPDLLKMGAEHPWLTDWAALANACRTGTMRLDREVTVGQRYYQQVLHYVPALDRLRIYGMDITERKQADECLRQTAEELRRSNGDLEQFAYVASHDLQEPLRMVTGFLQLLQRQYSGKLDANADKYIDFAVDGAKRMQTLINDLLAYSRVGTRGQQATTTAADAALRQALVNLRASIEETAAEITSGKLPVVRADEGQLVQLFQNLIGNAVKFRGPSPPQVRVEARRQDGGWLFTVADNGIGIDPEFRQRIFVIFQRLHARGQYAGTGIGLAICKRIMDRHGGRIWVESQPGHGSIFHFTLPD